MAITKGIDLDLIKYILNEQREYNNKRFARLTALEEAVDKLEGNIDVQNFFTGYYTDTATADEEERIKSLFNGTYIAEQVDPNDKTEYIDDKAVIELFT